MSHTLCVLKRLVEGKPFYELRLAKGTKTGAHMLTSAIENCTSEFLAVGAHDRVQGLMANATLMSVYTSENVSYQLYWQCEEQALVDCLRAMQRDTKGTYQHNKLLNLA